MNFKGLKWTRNQKIRIVVAADCLYIFQMFKSTYRPHFFYVDFAMYSVQPDKILRKNVNFKGLKWTRTQKIQILQTLNQHFDLIKKKKLLSNCFMRIIFKKIKFLIFLVKKQSLYLCKFTDLFPILKNSLGSTFFLSYTHHFFV